MKTAQWYRFSLALVVVVGLVSACAPVRAEAPQPARTAELKRPRNLILFIGDGMGPQQIGLFELWAREAATSKYADRVTHYRSLANRGWMGLSLHSPAGALVVDSACSATQLATGQPAPPEVLGLNTRGDRVPTVLEAARAAGKATGLVSDTRITHATPGAFVAHVPHRSMETVIAEQVVASGADVMLSGGGQFFAPKGADRSWSGGTYDPGSKRSDGRDLAAEARAAGYTVAFDIDGLEGAGPRVLGLFSKSGMSDAFGDRRVRETGDTTGSREPTLAEMTHAALMRLEGDPDGFFLMVEAGQIDWAAHANDAGWMLAEMERMDSALAVISSWMAGREDTVLAVTADHETGGFGLSYHTLDVPAAVELPGNGMMGMEFHPGYNFGRSTTLDQIWAQKRSIGSAIDGLPTAKAERTAALAERLSAITGVSFSAAEAARALSAEGGDSERAGATKGPLFDPADIDQLWQAYRPSERDRVSAMASRALDDRRGVVWATGTHTHTPVPLVVVGPTDFAAGLGHLTHHVLVGQALFSWLGLPGPQEP